MSVLKVSVSAVELAAVLNALIGPDHHIRELQYTRSLPDNPINVLVDEFNAFATEHNKETPDATVPT